MPRYIRNTAILAKIETTSGVDATPTGGANAILVSDVTANPLNATNVDRALLRPFFGGSEQLVGTAYKEVSFSVEVAGSGAAGTAPAFGPLLRACGFAEVVAASSRVEYTPITASPESVTIYVYDDGTLHRLVGARGTFEMDLGLGNRPVFKFRFLGLDGGDIAANASGLSFAAFKTPQVVTDANSGDITLGASYATGALTGGTAYPSTGMTLNLGGAIDHSPLLGGESIDITGRDVTGSMQLDLTSAQEVAFMASVKANTLQALGFIHGTAAGNTTLIHMPAVQLINPSKAELKGRRLIAYDIGAKPVAGNDELRLVFK